ncbi:PP2C family protein-serine/threonine phosphatase [Blastococcus goldschmidtiae]|uniref:PP2C family protein-serine/threonine phosphatase n=1 Tax=Blastococcus goldschmidtiae TaxID=3075546 RepID=A0ABU2KBP1_9ACTN|nr:PP2C family protein-serine/threonine phosphatase [Blastococcus sp. DSM 46792]MDT0277611.1 PP2C family protein-serine/threonine phosphatase [Blastococcus sp. DSM 46792]
MTEETHRSALSTGYAHADLSLEQLWMRYFALGGTGDLTDVDAFLHGLATLPDHESDLLAHAVNERLDELSTRHRVPYSRVIPRVRPTTGALAALARLLESAGTAPPERLPDLLAEAGRLMDVDVTVHRIDHEQRCLVRLGPARAGSRRRLGLDSTMAGRAFRTQQLVASDREGQPRLWVPVVEGADRIGVLEVRVDGPGALDDPALREQCWWLASLLARLLVSMEPYGDGLERPRRSRAMSPSAELIWQQLPPLTATTDSFVLAGRLEPSYDVGGDALDYALSEQTVSLGMFDAVGHGMPAALMVAATLAAYRSTRRDGRGVFDQARAIDDVVSEQFRGSDFVTGVIAELDLGSGRLRYINAGHPAPLLLREGRVVKELGAGRRVPFGLETRGLIVGEEALEPGDWLALYTDGITEARDAAGAWFGEDRLSEFLRRAIAGGQPPAETVRRLTTAVLDHQGGLLQDDASVLLARWKQP